MPDPATFALLALLGLAAGILGGLAGLGGSMIMLPGLGLIIGFTDERHAEQHIFMASALVVNVLVALPATWRHHRNNAIDATLLRRTLPGQALGVALGVLLSNHFEGARLTQILGAMIALVVVINLVRAHRNAQRAQRRAAPKPSSPATAPAPPTVPPTSPPATPPASRLAPLSAAVGFLSGLVGLGGGALAIPMLQACGVEIKRALAVSSAMIVATSSLGAIVKFASIDTASIPGLESLSTADFTRQALVLAAIMGPLAAVGGVIGAELVSRLPAATIRWIVSALLLVAASRMLNLW
jgi:uncharacterized membrane protein YfcA